MSGKKDALDKAKLNLAKFRSDKRGPVTLPELHKNRMGPLPGSTRGPSGKPAEPGWQGEFARRTGAGYLQADHVATLPNPLVWNWPGSRDVLYTWCHNHYHDPAHHPVSELLSSLSNGDVARLLEALDSFKLSDLASEGALIYQGLVDEQERRQATQGKTRVHVDARVVHEEHEEDEHQEELEQQKKRLLR